MLQPYSAVGTLNLDGAGNFTLSEWLYTNGSVSPQSYSGTYATNPTTCAIQLTYSSTQASSINNAAYMAPPAFSALVGTNGKGFITVAPSSGTTLTGSLSSTAAPNQ
jgi:hypothetical protein